MKENIPFAAVSAAATEQVNPSQTTDARLTMSTVVGGATSSLPEMDAPEIQPFSVSGQMLSQDGDHLIGVRISVSREGRIAAIDEVNDPDPGYIFPGFVDAHVHLESSMLTPAQFARVAVRHGTLAAVADPHEIANVLGEEGVRLMIELTRQTPFVFGIGAPSCVPATPFETSGAVLDAKAVERILQWREVTHLSEVMDYPGVIRKDPELMAKIGAAIRLGKPVDGHAPGLGGKSLRAYVAAGVSTDHECLSFDEALEKTRNGMNILIRDGSAARLVEGLIPLLSRYPSRCMFCSDDAHPNDLFAKHINRMVALAYHRGVSLQTIILAASVNPVQHYHLPLGLLHVGDTADFQVVSDLNSFEPRQVWLRGRSVWQDGESLLPEGDVSGIHANRFDAATVTVDDLRVPEEPGMNTIRVIGLLDGGILTKDLHLPPAVKDGELVPDLDRDLLKIVVCNRYKPEKPAVAFVSGFGLVRGAIATSVSHDSHNIIAVGANDEAIATAINQLVLMRGGLTVVDSNRKVITSLPLPIAGLISDRPASFVARQYEDCDKLAKMFGSKLHAPFMTLSFLALPVVPELKMTDRGLFDPKTFQHVGLAADAGDE